MTRDWGRSKMMGIGGYMIPNLWNTSLKWWAELVTSGVIITHAWQTFAIRNQMAPLRIQSNNL